jgi:hypothetical protein
MTPVTLESLAERVTALENELAELRRSHLHPTAFKDWRAALTVPFDPAFQSEVDEAGRKIRQSDEPEARD